MKYTGTFRDIDNNEYTVQIVTNQSVSQTMEIILSSSPFETEMDASDDNIYKPVKYQSATVSVVTRSESDYMFNVYSGSANGTCIKVFDEDDNLVWGGFATPVLYNNGYTAVHEILEIEAIDGLSILQYYKYSTPSKTIKTFAEIVTNILAKCEVYDEFYVSSSVRLTSSSSTPIFNDCYISEQNFFDEKDSNETDDDVAWSCQEVLEEICQYFSLVCVAEGNRVYFLDLDAVAAGVNTFWKYDIGSTSYTQVTLSDAVSISGEMYRGSGSSISLDNVYNKVSVKDDFYKFDNVIPDIFSTAQNITKSSDPTLTSSNNINNGAYGEIVQGVEGNTPQETNNNMIIMVDRIYEPEDEVYTDYYVVMVKYFKNPYYRFYSYGSPSNDSLNYTDTKTMHGAIIAKFFVKKMEKKLWGGWLNMISGKTAEQLVANTTLDNWMTKNEISTVSFQNYIMMLNPNQNHINNNNITSYPYFETIGTDTNALFGGTNAYLVIQGTYIFHYFNEDPYPFEGTDISEGRYAMDQGHTYILAKLQWGNQYWNGTAWTSTASTFQIPYVNFTADSDERRADSTMFKELQFINTVTWRLGISEKGHLIKMPEGKIMSGLPKLTVYKPFDPNYHSSKSGDNEGQWYKHSVVFLKDFAIKAVIGDPTYSDVNNTDTVYTNIIDNHYAQELGDITFKICTNDNKNPNYSSVAYKEGGEYKFLDTVYNEALTNNGVIDWNGNQNVAVLRPEEWLVYRLTNQYSQPKIRLELELKQRMKPYSLVTDKWLLGKKFIVDSQNTDFARGKTTVTLVEKG